jgi:hypothetical protein
MSQYDCLDLGSDLIERLKQAGYKIYFGNGYDTEETDDGDTAQLPDPPKEGEREYDASIDGYWFTWASPKGGDIEVGVTCDTGTAAWGEAMDHWFNNAEIVVRSSDEIPALTNRELGTVLAALRTYQEADIEAAGDLPEHILDIATDGDSFERLTHDEIDDLCERLNVEPSGNHEALSYEARSYEPEQCPACHFHNPRGYERCAHCALTKAQAQELKDAPPLTSGFSQMFGTVDGEGSDAD